MKESFHAVPITEHVYWVGAIDWNIRDFHGYATNRGSTYNAYLVLADTVTLIDTVKAPFRDEMMARIASVIDLRDISVIVSNHSEMDHSGSLPEVIDMVKPDRVYASKMGLKALESHFHHDLGVIAVEDGGSIGLGSMNMSFYETRMLHWPDSMIGYLPEEKLLFSQDAFGMHLASTERFADMISPSVLEYEAKKYYANILLPYSQLITKLLDKVGQLGLDIRTVAPDHGPVWRTDDDIRKVLGWYTAWAEQKPAPKAVVVYDTMWKSSDTMARVIADGLTSGGISVKVMSLGSFHRSDVITELMDAGALIVGSPTLNNNMFPTVADAMIYLKGLKPKNLIGAVFGSYGWSGEAVKQLESLLDEMNITRVADSVKTLYVPDQEAIGRCYNLGKTVAEKLRNLLES
ncbi:FprA family A-type flavoprotein [bacterium]|nr:FprA family A-type flavoprotein [bacterium]